MAGADTLSRDELFEDDFLTEESCSTSYPGNGPSNCGDEMQGLRSKNTLYDPFESDSETNGSESCLSDLGFKNLFGGSSLFGEHDDDCQKSMFEAAVEEGDADGEELEWPTPPEFCEQSDVLSTVESLALENFDVILERTVRERSSELNELQNSSRPVTGTSARDNLSDFFIRATNPNAARSQERRSLPGDVQNLIQRSIVTSALRRHGFRTALEQSLSSRLSQASALRNNIISRNSPSRSPSGTSTPSASQELDTMSVVSDIISDQTDASETASDIEQLHRVIDAGVQVLSETIEEDLTHLHHLHVVSSVLSGGFRNNLERLFQERARSVGGGEVVEQFIRSLPSAPRPRTNNADRMQATRTSQVTSRTQNMQLSSEISSLKQQVAEMKEMMQMTFEMQMDTQRAIRQEVAAVFGAFMQQMSQAAASGLPSHQTAIPTQNSVPVAAGSCVICLDCQADAVFYQCGHLCACHTCGLRLKMQGHKCPMCRAPIRDVIRAYKTQ